VDVDKTAARVVDLTRDYLEGGERFPEGTEVGAFAIVYELVYPEGGAGIGYSCSDGREWVHAGLLRAALRSAERDDDAEDDSED